jgi:hypothetical protein
VTGLRAGRQGFIFQQGLRMFFFATVFTPTLESTQPPIKWVSGERGSSAVKRPERESDHSLSSSAEVKNAWSNISTQPIHPHGVVPN